MRTFHMRISGDTVASDSAVAGVRGSGNVDKIVAAFDESWDGCAKTAVWFDARGEQAGPPRLLTAGMLVDYPQDLRTYLLVVPPEALRHPGECTLVLEGWTKKTEGEDTVGALARTVRQSFQVADAPVSAMGISMEPDAAQALQQEVDALLEQVSGAGEARDQALQSAQEATQSAQAATQSAQAATQSAQEAAQSAQEAAQSAQSALNAGRDTAASYALSARCWAQGDWLFRDLEMGANGSQHLYREKPTVGLVNGQTYELLVEYPGSDREPERATAVCRESQLQALDVLVGATWAYYAVVNHTGVPIRLSLRCTSVLGAGDKSAKEWAQEARERAEEIQAMTAEDVGAMPAQGEQVEGDVDIIADQLYLAGRSHVTLTGDEADIETDYLNFYCSDQYEPSQHPLPVAWGGTGRTWAAGNPNLLDNWYFADPVNQRGRSEYTQAGLCLDRWASTVQRVAVNDGYISCLFSSQWSGINQRIENFAQLKGKKVTLSILYRGYTYFMALKSIYKPGYAFVSQRIPASSGWNLFSITGTVPDTDDVQFMDFTIQMEGGDANTVDLLAAKLEVGSQQTLAHKEGNTWVLNDPPPDKAQELFKCQRYFQCFRTQSLRPTYGEDFRPVMATAQPTMGTMAVDGVTYYTASSDL